MTFCNYEIIYSSNDAYILKKGERVARFDQSNLEAYEFCKNLYKTVRAVKPADRLTMHFSADAIEAIEAYINSTGATTSTKDTSIADTKTLLSQLIQFFSEFHFEPNFRFVNTLAHSFGEKNGATKYIENYFSLTDNAYSREICDKMTSPEFKSLLDGLRSKPAPTNHINTRFKVYYGSQGTGKTTKAMQETNGKCVVCNSAMLPADLMEDFVFVDGKATFQPSALWLAMVNGDKITLDEINLLPFDSLRFLQTILDGKKEFLYKGHQVIIADGFQVIGTMNLTVNGMTYGLPEPLIDRACALERFALTAENLLAALD